MGYQGGNMNFRAIAIYEFRKSPMKSLKVEYINLVSFWHSGNSLEPFQVGFYLEPYKNNLSASNFTLVQHISCPSHGLNLLIGDSKAIAFMLY